MPKLSSQELRSWYQKFATELYEKVEIDVTRKEDLGRIKNYKILEWNVDDPTAPLTQETYAYIPHDGTNYAVPEPGTDDFSKYSQWMMKNLNPDINDDQIQKLYDQSCEGTLMVSKPGADISLMQQVQTDAAGNIHITLPSVEYANDNETSPPAPEVFEEPDPARFGRPETPVRPQNMNPSWLSRLGHYLGFTTDYTKLLRYQQDRETYPDRMNAWAADPNGLSAFQRACEDRQTYLDQVAAYMANPYCKLNAIVNGARARMMPNQLSHNESVGKFLIAQHRNTNQGSTSTELEKIEKQLDYAKHTDQALYDIVGHDPHPEQHTHWVNLKVFGPKGPEGFQFKPYDLPSHPDEYNISEAQLQEHTKKWSDLAAIAGFAALADYSVSGDPLRPGFNREETSDMAYSMLLTNIFTQGRPDSSYQLSYVPAARNKAQLALYAYEAGAARPLGELLARSLRQTMREAAGLHNLSSDHTLGTLFLISKLHSTLQEHPDLLKASGLKPEEMQEAQRNAELYNTLTNGIKARKALLEHAIGKKTLTKDELMQAGKDALFANIVMRKIGNAYNEQDKALKATEEFQKNEQAMIDGYGCTNVEAQAAKAEKEGRNLEAEALRKQAAEMKYQADVAKGKILLQELTRPGYVKDATLLNKDWLDAAMEASGLNQILSGNAKGIIDIFINNTALSTITKNLPSESEPAQPEKVLEIQDPQIQNPQGNLVI